MMHGQTQIKLLLHLVDVPYYFTYIDDARSNTNQKYIYVLYLAQLFLEIKMFQAKVVEKIDCVLNNIFFLPKIVQFMR
jgi:hypothetical protein